MSDQRQQDLQRNLDQKNEFFGVEEVQFSKREFVELANSNVVPKEFPSPFPIQPVNKRAIVFQVAFQEEQSQGGIWTPGGQTQTKEGELDCRGIIVAVAEDCEMTFTDPDGNERKLEVGMVISMNPYVSATTIVKGATYRIVHEVDIWGIQTGDTMFTEKEREEYKEKLAKSIQPEADPPDDVAMPVGPGGEA